MFSKSPSKKCICLSHFPFMNPNDGVVELCGTVNSKGGHLNHLRTHYLVTQLLYTSISSGGMLLAGYLRLKSLPDHCRV